MKDTSKIFLLELKHIGKKKKIYNNEEQENSE